MATGLEAVNLTKRFGSGAETVTAVDNISFAIEEGELFSLLGESGCGKTTTLRMIAGLEPVTEGMILFSGQNYTHVPSNKRNIGMVFQSYALYPHMSVFENVAYGLRVRRVTTREVSRKVSEALDIVDLPPDKFAQRRPSELSGGQQQRIALARALVYDPKLLLFDEPLSNLDAKLRVYMREEIRKVQQRAGITAIYVTHDQEEALVISDRIAVMFDGVIEQVGTPVEVYDSPNTVKVADFIGKANLIPARLKDRGARSATAKLPSGDVVQGRILSSDVPVNADVTIMIRPERLQLQTLGNGRATSVNATPSVNTLSAEVQALTYLGSRTRYVLLTSFGTELTLDSVRLHGTAKPGTEVVVTFESDEALLLPSARADHEPHA